jgi:hypothetical protein
MQYRKRRPQGDETSLPQLGRGYDDKETEALFPASLFEDYKMRQAPIQIVTDSMILSDLFFNHSHPNMEALYDEKKDAVSREELEGAVALDADGFACCLLSQVDDEDRSALVAWLTEDFLERL